MNEFQLNRYITLKLKEGKTRIYINGTRFSSCTYLIYNWDVKEMVSLKKIPSFDELVESLNLKFSFKGDSRISPEEEFWAHCSYMQVWVENNYNSKLLNKYQAFSILRALYNLGDPVAKEVFIRELITRFASGFLPVLYFFLEENFLRYLNQEDFERALDELLLNPDINHKEIEIYLNKLINYYISKHQFPKAISIRRKKAEFKDIHGKEWLKLGHLYKNIEDYEEALKAYQKSLDKNPSDVLSLLQVGKIYLKLNKKEDAEKLFKQILARNFPVKKSG